MPLMGFTIRVADGAVQWEILSALMQDPGVAFVEQDQIVYAFRHQLLKLPWMPQQPLQPSQLLPNRVNQIDITSGNNAYTACSAIIQVHMTVKYSLDLLTLMRLHLVTRQT
jgi:hypothetical protein